MRKPNINAVKRATQDYRAALVRAEKVQTHAWTLRKKRHFAQLKRVRTWDEARQVCQAVGSWKPILDFAVRKWTMLSTTLRQLKRVWTFAKANDEQDAVEVAAEAMVKAKYEQAVSIKETATLLRDVDACACMFKSAATHKVRAIEKLFSLCKTKDDLETVAGELRRIHKEYIMDRSSMYYQLYSRLLERLGEPIDNRAV